MVGKLSFRQNRRKAANGRFPVILDRLLAATDWIGIGIILVMMFHVTLDVVLKYLGLPQLPGTTDIVSYWYMPLIAFLPIAAVESMNGHIRADLLKQFGSATVLRVGEIIAYLFSAGFFALFAWVGWNAAEAKRAIGAYVMGVDATVIWPSYYAIPLGCGLMVIVVLFRLLGLEREHPYNETADQSELGH